MVEIDPIPTVVKADMTTLRTVKRSIKAAANGAVRPNNSTLILIAAEIVDLDQPKASWSGTINTDGADRYPALAARVKKVTPKANQAG